MKYMGSKSRYANEILEEYILKFKKNSQPYVEPFCGGCNVIDKVKGARIANDSNEYLIEMWKALQSGWMPPRFVSEEEYKNIYKNMSNYPKHLIGYVGFNISFSAKFFGGYAKFGESKHKNMRVRNYSDEAYRNIVKQIPNIKKIIFYCGDYDKFPIPDNSIIYCDPPYQNTTKYNGTNEFNYPKFWDWCRTKVKEGHQVFISEYNAPDDFVCIWKKESFVSVGKDKDSVENTNIEKLFIHITENERRIEKIKNRGFFNF